MSAEHHRRRPIEPVDAGPWLPRPPAPVRMRPASQIADLRARRVVIGDPEYGWRGGLRADDADTTPGGRRIVPVLAEADYYRAERTGTETPTTVLPVEQVWAEHVDADDGDRARRSGDDQAGRLSRLSGLDAPPDRWPVPARAMHRLTGRRIVLVSPNGDRRDIRAISELYQADDGGINVRVCHEHEWYRWVDTGQPPESTPAPIYLIWAE